MPDDRAPITCHHCEWTGIFSDLSLEAFQDLAQYSCPECDTHLVLVSDAPRPQSGAEDHARGGSRPNRAHAARSG